MDTKAIRFSIFKSVLFVSALVASPALSDPTGSASVDPATLRAVVLEAAAHPADGLNDYGENFQRAAQIGPKPRAQTTMLVERKPVSGTAREMDVAALRTLFQQPEFNRLDGLSDYAEDYTRPSRPHRTTIAKLPK